MKESSGAQASPSQHMKKLTWNSEFKKADNGATVTYSLPPTKSYLGIYSPDGGLGTFPPLPPGGKAISDPYHGGSYMEYREDDTAMAHQCIIQGSKLLKKSQNPYAFKDAQYTFLCRAGTPKCKIIVSTGNQKSEYIISWCYEQRKECVKPSGEYARTVRYIKTEISESYTFTIHWLLGPPLQFFMWLTPRLCKSFIGWWYKPLSLIKAAYELFGSADSTNNELNRNSTPFTYDASKPDWLGRELQKLDINPGNVCHDTLKHLQSTEENNAPECIEDSSDPDNTPAPNYVSSLYAGSVTDAPAVCDTMKCALL